MVRTAGQRAISLYYKLFLTPQKKTAFITLGQSVPVQPQKFAIYSGRFLDSLLQEMAPRPSLRVAGGALGFAPSQHRQGAPSAASLRFAPSPRRSRCTAAPRCRADAEQRSKAPPGAGKRGASPKEHPESRWRSVPRYSVLFNCCTNRPTPLGPEPGPGAETSRNRRPRAASQGRPGRRDARGRCAGMRSHRTARGCRLGPPRAANRAIHGP